LVGVTPALIGLMLASVDLTPSLVRFMAARIGVMPASVGFTPALADLTLAPAGPTPTPVGITNSVVELRRIRGWKVEEQERAAWLPAMLSWAPASARMTCLPGGRGPAG
jgi:hypothetical protein